MLNGTIQEEAVRLKGRLYTLTVLQLLHHDLEMIKQHLDVLVSKAPKMFAWAPIILDLQALTEPVALSDICEILKTHQMIPVGVQGVSEESAHALGLVTFHTSSKISKMPEEVIEEPTQETREEPAVTLSTIITKPVRSGQQIYAQGGDLIVLASVSQGAELLSNGHIHVYGALRGRALAGIHGNTEARIFCQQLDAELLSIAGHYTVNDNMKKNPVLGAQQVYLSEGKLQITPL